MIFDILPLSLKGLTPSELIELNLLPWKRGNLNSISNLNKNLSFLLVSGRLEDSESGIIGPGKEILGVKPFFKQSKKMYITSYYSEIIYIETNHLIEFFFKHPMLLRSYMMSEINTGSQPLEEWTTISNIWGVASDQALPESIQFALSLCSYYAESSDFKKKVIYLEFQHEGMSIFTVLNKEIPPAFIQLNDNPQTINKLLESRITSLTDQIDILNVQFLSPWKINHDAWISLYWALEKNYDEIIIHLGSDNQDLDFIYKDINLAFCVLSSLNRDLEILNHSKNHIYWPRTVEIYRKNLKKFFKNSFVYPDTLSLQTIQAIESKILYSYKEDNEYWSWFKGHIQNFLEVEHAIIIADYFDNFSGFLVVIKKLWKLKDKPLVDSLQKETLFLQGKSGILGAIAFLSKNWNDFYKQCQHLVDYDITTLFRPIFPTTSLFSDKPIRKYLENLFKDAMQDTFRIVLPSISYTNNEIIFLSSGKLADNLIKTAFIYGFVDEEESSSTHERRFGSTHKNEWSRMLCCALRMGYENITFINFEQPTLKINDMRLSRKLSTEKLTPISFDNLTGYMSYVRSVPASTKEFLNDQIDEIFNSQRE